MKIISIALLINHAFRYVMDTTIKYNIDESHALKHSLEVYQYAKDIYENQVVKYPYLEKQKEIIFVSAILHDMCDKKYMNQENGVQMIKTHMKDYFEDQELVVIDKIISTMSYSTVKKLGYPDLGEYQLAYHIVREADLLSAYDIDRCVIYGMYVEKLEYDAALKRAIELFKSRILKYRSDNLFITQYSKKESLKLHKKAERELDFFKQLN